MNEGEHSSPSSEIQKKTLTRRQLLLGFGGGLISFLGGVAIENTVENLINQQVSTSPHQTATTEVITQEILTPEEELLLSINEERLSLGLNEVTLTPELVGVAFQRSTDMAQRNYFSHLTPERTTFLGILRNDNIRFKLAGEIIAENNYSDDKSATEAMNSYMGSPHHKEIIIDPRYSEVGVGYAASNDKVGENRMHYFTVIFVQPYEE